MPHFPRSADWSLNRTVTGTARFKDIDIKTKPDAAELVCLKSPDKIHHYTVSSSQNLVYIENGSMVCYHCIHCNKHKDVTHFWEPATYTDAELDK